MLTIPKRSNTKHVLLCGMVLAVNTGGVNPVASKPALAETRLEQAMREAAARQEPLLLQFSSSRCKSSTRFDRATESDPAIRAAMKRAVVVRIDNDTRAGRTVANQFDVAGAPQLVLINRDGEVADRFFGFLGLSRFAAIVDEAFADQRSVETKRLAYEAQPTWRLAAVLGRLRAAERKYGEAMQYLRSARSIAPLAEQASLRVLLFWCTYESRGSEFDLSNVLAAADDVFALDPPDTEARAIVALMMANMAAAWRDRGIAERYVEAVRSNLDGPANPYVRDVLKDLDAAARSRRFRKQPQRKPQPAITQLGKVEVANHAFNVQASEAITM